MLPTNRNSFTSSFQSGCVLFSFLAELSWLLPIQSWVKVVRTVMHGSLSQREHLVFYHYHYVSSKVFVHALFRSRKVPSFPSLLSIFIYRSARKFKIFSSYDPIIPLNQYWCKKLLLKSTFSNPILAAFPGAKPHTCSRWHRRRVPNIS